MIKLVIGLGNPGRQYAFTWHNMGFLIVDEYLRRKKTCADRPWKNLLLTKLDMDEGVCHFVKPQLYMNRSGWAVVPFIQKKAIRPEETLVIHDDMDLVQGRFQIKLGGGAGGHHGLESLFDVWGQRDFIRLRVGVGRSEPGADVDHLIHRQPVEAAKALAIPGADALEKVFSMGPEQAMNVVNVRPAECGTIE